MPLGKLEKVQRTSMPGVVIWKGRKSLIIKMLDSIKKRYTDSKSSLARLLAATSSVRQTENSGPSETVESPELSYEFLRECVDHARFEIFSTEELTRGDIQYITEYSNELLWERRNHLPSTFAADNFRREEISKYARFLMYALERGGQLPESSRERYVGLVWKDEAASPKILYTGTPNDNWNSRIGYTILAVDQGASAELLRNLGCALRIAGVQKDIILNPASNEATKKQFLKSLANTMNDKEAIDKIRTRFPEIFKDSEVIKEISKSPYLPWQLEALEHVPAEEQEDLWLKILETANKKDPGELANWLKAQHEKGTLSDFLTPERLLPLLKFPDAHVRKAAILVSRSLKQSEPSRSPSP